MICSGKNKLLTHRRLSKAPLRSCTTVSSLFKSFITLFFLWASFCLGSPVSAQDVIVLNGKPCDMDGDAKRADVAELNRHKNRYIAPVASDFTSAITLDALLNSGDPNQFSQEKAAVIRGYVYDVKIGGVETCNCKARDVQFRDTHIELVPDEAHTAARYRVIAEVTPRQRQMMASRGADWSTPGLKKSLKGKWVELAGWLTYDDEHETASYANDPDDVIGQRNWRATAWEVHPVTYLKIISKREETPLSTLIGEQAGVSNSHRNTDPKGTVETTKQKEPGTGHATLWIVVAGLLVLVVVYFLLKKMWV